MPPIRPTQARAAVLWGLASVVLLHLGLAAVIDVRWPRIYDAEFYRRLELLQARRAESPGRPLALLIGSSRTVGSFRPEILPPLYAADGREVLVFNYSHLGGDPIALLMGYQRLRRAGVRPDYLVVEVLPSCLTMPRPSMSVTTMTMADATTLLPFYNPLEMGRRYLQPRLNPWYKHRGEILHAFAPALAAPGSVSEWETTGRQLGRLGGSVPGPGLRTSATPEEIRRATDFARAGYGPRLADFHLADNQVRAVDEILRAARADGTVAVLVPTPESSEYRGWYSPAAETTLARFLEEQKSRHGVPVVDARRWLSDGDFSDGHHVLLSGADRFTRLLGERVLTPLVGGRLTTATAAR